MDKLKILSNIELENVEEWRVRAGKMAFSNYVSAKNGVAYDNKPIPQWDDLPEDVRVAWMVAALSVINWWAQKLMERIRKDGFLPMGSIGDGDQA